MKKLLLLLSIVLIVGMTQTKAQGVQWWSQANAAWMNTCDSIFHSGNGINEQFFAPMPINIVSIKSGVSMHDTSNANLISLLQSPYYNPHQDSVQKYLVVGDSILYDTTLGGKYAFTRCMVYDSSSTDSLQFQIVRNGAWTPFPMLNLNTGGIEVTMVPTPGQYTFYKPNGVYYFIKVRVIKINKNAVGNIFCDIRSQQ